jgi:hypothetical protein
MVTASLLWFVSFFVGCKTNDTGSDQNQPAQSIQLDQVQILATNPTGTSFTFPPNTAMQISFSITGIQDPRHMMVFGSRLPTGAVLDGASSLMPIFRWNAPVAGTYRFDVVVRDLLACQSVGVQNCSMGPQATSSNTVNNYDAVGSFLLTVTTSGLGSAGVGTLFTRLGPILKQLGIGSELLQKISPESLAQIEQQLRQGATLQAIMAFIQQLGISNNSQTGQ